MTTPSKAKILQRRVSRAMDTQTAVKMKREGAVLRDIAKQIGRSVFYVHKLLKEAVQQWRLESVEEIAAWKRECIAEYDAAARAAWVAYEKSKQDRERREETNTPDGVTTKTVTEGQCGDPAYLRVVMEALANIREILGVDAPKKSELDATLHKGEEPVKVLEDADWYGNADRIEAATAANCETPPAIAAPTGDPLEPGTVQGGSLRPAVRQDGGGPPSNGEGTRELSGATKGGD